ncbi:hypothetical protein DL765_001992 [Monosporascus sp. GIB2]|nr:hypothetical protein DL765_001992 [Monosporascus sp. GIB2]
MLTCARPYIPSWGVLEVLSRRESFQSPSGRVDVGKWPQFFSMDVPPRVALGNLPGLVRCGEDAEGIPAAADYVLNKGPSQLAARIRCVCDSLRLRVGKNNYNNDQSDKQRRQKDLCLKSLDGHTKRPEPLSQDEVLGIIVHANHREGADTSTAGTLPFMYTAPAHRGPAGAIVPGPRRPSLRRHPLGPAEVGCGSPRCPTPCRAQGVGARSAHSAIDAVVDQNRDVYGADASEIRPER